MGGPGFGDGSGADPRGSAHVQRQLREMADELGVGPALRRIRRAVHPTARRNRRDDEHLSLLLSFVLSEDSCCIDIGAHTGDVLRQIIQLAPRGRHVAYEPLPHLHELLVAEFPTVDVRKAALADRAGTRSFTHVASRPAYSGLLQRLPSGTEEFEQIRVTVETLDEALPADYRPALVKIDVEGAEYHALRGGIKMLSASQPYVVFEFGAASASHYGVTPQDMYKLIEDEIGLRIYDMDGVGPLTLAAFREAYHTGSRFNFVAHA
jgi:FkbM family methyltransferase